MVDYILASFNFSEFIKNPFVQSLTAYQLYLGFLFWPVIFAAAIGLVYRTTHNIGAVVAAIFIVFALFGHTNQFIQAPQFSIFFFLIAIVGWAATFMALFFKKKNS